MALRSTAGAADANTFATAAEFKAYWGSRPNGTRQAALSDAAVEPLLIHAARVLCAIIPWTGSAATSTQALAWPRTGMLNRNGFAIAADAVPADLKDAQCELAGLMLDNDTTADNDAVKSGIASLKAGPVAVEFRDSRIASAADVQARDVDTFDRMVPDSVRMLLVPSWWTRPSIRPAFMCALT